MIDTPRLILVTGVMAAGKSTVAEHLARRFTRGVHLRGDVFRRMIVSGRVEMGPDPSPQALAQLALRYRLAAAAADAYLAEGFSVVYQDVVIGRFLADVVAGLVHRPLHLVVLCPSVPAVMAREAGRAKRGYGSFPVEALDRVLRNETPRLGYWLDTSDLDVDQSVERIVDNLELAVVHIETTANEPSGPSP